MTHLKQTMGKKCMLFVTLIPNPWYNESLIDQGGI